MKEKKLSYVQRLVISGMCLALCMVLPFLGGNVQQILNKISPMHFPVMICGFICGGPYGMLVGLVAPILRSAIFSVPVMLPSALAMSFEMATYGLCTGVLSRVFPKKIPFLYLTLIIAMIAGRIVWGLVSVPLYGFAGKSFTWQIFVTNGFVNAVLAIALQLAIIPTLIIALKKARVIE